MENKDKKLEKDEKSDICGLPCEVYSRIVGYYRPVQSWNNGKVEEFKDRTIYDTPTIKEGGEK